MQGNINFKNLKYFENYLLEELSPEEADFFDKRLKSDSEFAEEYAQFLRLLAQSENLKSSDFQDDNTAWKSIEEGIYIPTSREVHIAEPWWRWKGAACIGVILFLGILAFWLLNPASKKNIELITKATADGQKATITLVDGTTIRLNSNSSISYPKEFSDSSRNILLTGEAFFDVTSDKKRPFVISSGQMKTTVLGTSFNIRAFSDEEQQEVAVKSGIVQVNFGNPKLAPAKLQVGDMARFDIESQSLELLKVDPESVAMWSQGYIYFDNEPLEQVLKSLSRWYGVEFTVENPGLLTCRITLKQRDENLKNILDIIKYASHVDYEFIDNRIIIKGKSC
ncbi:FecR family protein [Algoriphagus sp. Y33]|uniref:FecR family protein n=1 Tax=Algoriphagus sp. Y33 TaxID=2772483 RepID=UPI001782CA45|nr:FecR family protein [Algoriphagus sp. Y33]